MKIRESEKVRKNLQRYMHAGKIKVKLAYTCFERGSSQTSRKNTLCNTRRESCNGNAKMYKVEEKVKSAINADGIEISEVILLIKRFPRVSYMYVYVSCACARARVCISL